MHNASFSPSAGDSAPSGDSPALLHPLPLGGRVLANRVVFGAHLTNFGQNNVFSPRHAAYYRERAAGGAGLIVTEALTVHPLDWAYERVPFGFRDEIIPSLQGLADAVRQAGPRCLLLAQLNHTGGQSAGRLLRQSPWAPAPWVEPASRRMARAMLQAELREVVQGFADTAARVVRAGLDGVELNAAQWSLLRQFVSPLTNTRQDEYGGALENRVRFVREVRDAVRAALDAQASHLGAARPVLGLKLCGDELAPWGGLTVEDAARIALHLVQSGPLDYLAIQVGGPYSTFMSDAPMPVPEGHAAHLAAAIRKALRGQGHTLPVLAEGRIESAATAERILTAGAEGAPQADAVDMTRALITDPLLPRKVAWQRLGQGDPNGAEAEPVRPHVGHARYFAVRGDWNRPLSDLSNPRAGREALLPAPQGLSGCNQALVVG
ncbi:MAG TPA: mycofactocin system FadH/OYE family oxidoreductase, partial [bacterium]|nr:mycofactocin system FadH/OYE family oxidoreductase [bacterium]